MSDSQVINAARREPLGARILGEQVCSFLVWAPHASRVEVCTTQPQEHKILMPPTGSGYFHAVVADLPPGTLYRYRLNGEKERPDPASRYQPKGSLLRTIANRRGPVWLDRFRVAGIPRKIMFYQSCTLERSLVKGILKQSLLGWQPCKKLGVTAIESMPVANSPGIATGVTTGFIRTRFSVLRRSLRAEGLSQCLSSPGNRRSARCGLQPPWSGGKLPRGFRSLFHGSLQDPLGKGHQFRRCRQRRSPAIFHRECSAVDHGIPHRRASTRRHPRDCGSFRANVSSNNSAQPSTWRHRNWARRLSVSESNRNDARVVRAAGSCGWGLDAVWNDDFHHSLHVLVTGEQDGYYQDYRAIEDLAGCYREGFLYAGKYSKFRQKHYGNSSKEIPAKRFVVFAQNHDQVGNRPVGDRLSQLVSIDRLKLLAGTVLLSPFLPMLFMGEEYGESAPFQYFVSHEDRALSEAVHRGRKEEFARFGWLGDIPDPQAETTFLDCKLNWDLQPKGTTASFGFFTGNCFAYGVSFRHWRSWTRTVWR